MTRLNAKQGDPVVGQVVVVAAVKGGAQEPRRATSTGRVLTQLCVEALARLMARSRFE